MRKDRSPLGRGLGAVLGDAVSSSSISDIPVDKIYPNPDQPRFNFNDGSLLELCSSIQEVGIIQPITVRLMDNGGYMIISGERRWRASQMAGLTHIPAYVRSADDDKMMEMALIENIQREDLNAIEIALAYSRLLELLEIPQEELSKRVGKNRSTVSNYLRLLKLPPEVQRGIIDRKIEMGHARTLLSLSSADEMLSMYKRVVEEGLSVREVERLCKEVLHEEKKEKEAKRAKYASESKGAYKTLSRQLTLFFNAPVQLTSNTNGKGRITIQFASEDELMQIMEIIEKAQQSNPN